MFKDGRRGEDFATFGSYVQFHFNVIGTKSSASVDMLSLAAFLLEAQDFITAKPKIFSILPSPNC